MKRSLTRHLVRSLMIAAAVLPVAQTVGTAEARGKHTQRRLAGRQRRVKKHDPHGVNSRPRADKAIGGGSLLTGGADPARSRVPF